MYLRVVSLAVSSVYLRVYLRFSRYVRNKISFLHNTPVHLILDLPGSVSVLCVPFAVAFTVSCLSCDSLLLSCRVSYCPPSTLAPALSLACTLAVGSCFLLLCIWTYMCRSCGLLRADPAHQMNSFEIVSGFDLCTDPADLCVQILCSRCIISR